MATPGREVGTITHTTLPQWQQLQQRFGSTYTYIAVNDQGSIYLSMDEEDAKIHGAMKTIDQVAQEILARSQLSSTSANSPKKGQPPPIPPRKSPQKKRPQLPSVASGETLKPTPSEKLPVGISARPEAFRRATSDKITAGSIKNITQIEWEAFQETVGPLYKCVAIDDSGLIHLAMQEDVLKQYDRIFTIHEVTQQILHPEKPPLLSSDLSKKTSIFDVCLPVYEQSLVIQENVTQEMIVYAKDILPKIENVLERKIAMLRIAEQGLKLYAEKMIAEFPLDTTNGEMAVMLINSSVKYFNAPRKFHQRIYDAVMPTPLIPPIFDPDVCLPVYEQSQVIQEDVTQEMIAYAKDILPKITNEFEREKALMGIAKEGRCLYAEKLMIKFPPSSPEGEVAQMLINSAGKYFSIPRNFQKRIYDAVILTPNDSSTKS